MEQTEITLLEALHRMCHHKAKRKQICFEVTFDEGVTRKAYFAKRWCRMTESWSYEVQEGLGTPWFSYKEKQAVSAILSIPGMGIYGNTVRYHIHQM